jgi:hypothetical protein
MGVAVGASMVLWGDALVNMPASQKVPAILIACAVVALLAAGVLRILGTPL